MQVHSISTRNINADLISGPSLSLDGFGIDPPPQGAELHKRDSNRSKDHANGLYKLDQRGERTNQLPCHFEPKGQCQANTPANIFLAEQNFLLNNVKIVQSQLESMRRDSRFVSGVNTCIHSVAHVQDTLQDVGAQLWGDPGPVNGEIYANKPVRIEPNMELL